MAKGAPPKKYLHIERIDSPHFRPGTGPFNTLDEFCASFKYMGQYRAVNSVLTPRITPDWHFLEMHLQMQIPDAARDKISCIVQTFADEAAAEKGGIPWDNKNDDQAIIQCAKRIFKAAKSLISAIDDYGRAPAILLQRIEQMDSLNLKGNPFLRDEFYPKLSSLIGRAHILLEELRDEKEKGVKLEIGSAWRQFAFCMADIYFELTGDRPKVTEISDSNRDTEKHSKFTNFAFMAMSQVPAHLRDTGRDNIDTFATALRGPLQLWRQTRDIREEKSKKFR
jgi:hypothetical protein